MAGVGLYGSCASLGQNCGTDPDTGRYLVCLNGVCTKQEDSLAWTVMRGQVTAAAEAGAISQGEADRLDHLLIVTQASGGWSPTGGLGQVFFQEVRDIAPELTLIDVPIVLGRSGLADAWTSGDYVRAMTLASLAGGMYDFTAKISVGADGSRTVTNRNMTLVPVSDPVELNRVPTGLSTETSLNIFKALVETSSNPDGFKFLPAQKGATVDPQLLALAKEANLLTDNPAYNSDQGAGGKNDAQKETGEDGKGISTTTILIAAGVAMAAGGAYLLLSKRGARKVI